MICLSGRSLMKSSAFPGFSRHLRSQSTVEAKASATVTSADFRGLRNLKDAARSRINAGVVLYDGEAIAEFGDRMYAVPIRLLWELR
jgi:hypothetical protein